jgi:hypothetical protein
MILTARDENIISVLIFIGIICFVTIIFFTYHKDSDALTFVSQYTVYNYSTSDGVYKVFLLSKDRLNQSILLTNDNDITDKILITKLPYS